MSRVIYAIVNGPNEEYALRNARKSAFDNLIGAKRDGYNRFDYYHTFNEDTSRLPTKSDGTEYPTAAHLNSDEGRELLADGWNKTKEAFNHDLSAIREKFDEFNDGDIMKDISHIRSRFLRLGEYVGPSIRLYTEHGHGIRTPEDFRWACYDLDKPWVVPANIHL
jgi:hypothetical protein